MDFSGVIAFVLALVISEFIKGFSNRAGSNLSDTITKRSKPRRKKKSWFKRLILVIFLTGIIWIAIKFYPVALALI